MPRGRARQLLLLAGVGFLGSGLALIAIPLLGLWQRGSSDVDSLNRWITKPVPGAALTSCGRSSPGDYARVSFDIPARDGYAAVAADGRWDLLESHSMVHYRGSASPGETGNVIIGFHREPGFRNVDELSTGGTVTIQDRSCHAFRYQVTQRWVLEPRDVHQLVPTSGRDLTLVTCDPWLVDSKRLVWRASLVGS